MEKKKTKLKIKKIFKFFPQRRIRLGEKKLKFFCFWNLEFIKFYADKTSKIHFRLGRRNFRRGQGNGIGVHCHAFAIKGYKVTSLKIDPYVNVDAGTMNPTEHGEVFVTADGLETDQDIGTYERFLDTTLSRDNYMTTGAVYRSVIDRERALDYGGKCVEVVPHIPLEAIRRIEAARKKHKADITIIEVGGTVGEYQNILFLEASRMMKLKNPGDVLNLLVSYLPIPSKLGEMKSKPTQYAVRTLNSSGIQPDFIVCRAERTIDDVRREKLSVFCNVRPEDIIAAPDVASVYDVPLNFDKERFADKILKKFGLLAKKRDVREWRKRVEGVRRSQKTVKSALWENTLGLATTLWLILIFRSLKL